MGLFDRLVGATAAAPQHLKDLALRVLGPGTTIGPYEERPTLTKEEEEVWLSAEQALAIVEEAVSEMRAATKASRTARTRALNGVLRRDDIDPVHFKRLVRNHHGLSSEEFHSLIERYKEAPDRNEFSKEIHNPGTTNS